MTSTVTLRFAIYSSCEPALSHIVLTDKTCANSVRLLQDFVWPLGTQMGLPRHLYLVARLQDVRGAQPYLLLRCSTLTDPVTTSVCLLGYQEMAEIM